MAEACAAAAVRADTVLIRDLAADIEWSKANGFDVKALRAVIRLRKQEPTERNEQQLRGTEAALTRALGACADVEPTDYSKTTQPTIDTPGDTPTRSSRITLTPQVRK